MLGEQRSLGTERRIPNELLHVDEGLERERDQLQVRDLAVGVQRLVGEHGGEQPGVLESKALVHDDPLRPVRIGERPRDGPAARISELDSLK